MSSKVGIQNLKNVLDLALAGVEAGVAVAADGKIGFDDLAQVGKLIPVLPAALSSMGQVPAEFADLDQDEAAELVTYVMTKLAITDAKATAVIAASLKVITAGVGLVQAIKS